MEDKEQERVELQKKRDSLLQANKQSHNIFVRILTFVDLFSFIPVPKDEAVSTRQSLIGTALFFILFLSYAIYDFYEFVAYNTPIQQSYYTPLDKQNYTLPEFALGYLYGQNLTQTGEYNSFFDIAYTQEIKDFGFQDKKTIPLKVQPPSWVQNSTLQNYSVLRIPTAPAIARGLLYSTVNCTYSKISIKMCNLNQKPNNCENQSAIVNLCAGGRVFLFVKNDGEGKDVKYLIYNFFLIPRLYKRVTMEFQITKRQIYPDYFFRWSTQEQTRLTLLSINEQASNTSINDYNRNATYPLEMLSVSFQLGPQIMNQILVYSTILDHVATWGAFFSVLFGGFTLVFLRYNRNKFYKKNPHWDKFKSANQAESLSLYKQS